MRFRFTKKDLINSLSRLLHRNGICLINSFWSLLYRNQICVRLVLFEGESLSCWDYSWHCSLVLCNWMSPLTQGRGLKYFLNLLVKYWFVAPHAGAWIEIILHFVISMTLCRPSRRGVDWNFYSFPIY